jgi:2-hydroxychromene-2-carboxylate isomerase
MRNTAARTPRKSPLLPERVDTAMARIIEFYVDFISPFSYLALQRLPALAARFGYDVDYKVIDLKETKQLAGNIGPSTRDIPIKLRYAKVDQRRWAKRYGVPIATPAYYDSLPLSRGFFFAQKSGKPHDYLMLAFHKVWGEGSSMIDEGMLRELASKLGWHEDEFRRFTRSDEADAQHKASTLAAHARGVFGVPTCIVGDEMWWGNDRLDFVEEYLKNQSAHGA